MAVVWGGGDREMSPSKEENEVEQGGVTQASQDQEANPERAAASTSATW
jgi:hypothetical protein